MFCVKRAISDPFDFLNVTLIRILKAYLKPSINTEIIEAA